MLQRSRILAVATLGTVLFLFLTLEARLFFIQIIRGPELSESVENYQYKRVDVQVPRGAILAANGEVLARSIPRVEVWAATQYLDNPWTRKRDEAQETAKLLEPVLGKGAREILANFSRSGYRPLHRNITDPDAILRLYNLKKKRHLRGIDLAKNYTRRYPHGELLGHVLGYVDHEEKGCFGVESMMNDFLEGRAGSRIFQRDGVQKEIYSPDERQEQGTPGGEVHLTIDTAIQLFSEMELTKIERLYRPKWAAAVVMEPSTGKILAAASLPVLNPSEPGAGTADHWMNRVFTATYTPGSTFKPLIMATALDRGVVNLNETIDCEGGTWFYRGRRISDVHVNYRILEIPGILIKSSNIGMSKVALRLVPEGTPKGGAALKPIRDTLCLLGLGQRPGVFPPGQEAPGCVPALADWSVKYTLISISFGNEIAVTPIQMAAAFGALANNGCYVPPRLIERLVSHDQRVITPPEAPARRVFSEETSRSVKEMLSRVVGEGSGREARIPGITVGGKTGTAEKLPARTEVTSSFVAFAPVDRPALMVLVVVDEPQGKHYASQVAAPHVKAILERGLAHLGVVCKGEKKGGKEKEG